MNITTYLISALCAIILVLSTYQYVLNKRLDTLNRVIEQLQTTLIIKEETFRKQLFEDKQEIIFKKEKEKFDAKEHFINTDIGKHTISF